MMRKKHFDEDHEFDPRMPPEHLGHMPPPPGDGRRPPRGRRPPPPGDRRRPPRGGFRRPPHPPFRQFAQPLFRDKNFLPELKDTFLLMVLSEAPEGITGYSLQESYNFPRTTVVRRLEKLAEKEFVAIIETVEDNRSQKIFQITEKGKEYLEEMKKKWATEFMSFNDMMPPEMMEQVGFRRPLRRIMNDELDHLATKEDCSDFLRGVRSRVKSRLVRVERHAQATKEFKEKLDELIDDVESMEEYSPEKVRDKIHETLHQDPDEE